MGHGRLTSPLRGISAMRLVARRGLLAALACLFLSPAFSSPAFASCEYVFAGKSFWIRLIDPVASYSSKLGAYGRAEFGTVGSDRIDQTNPKRFASDHILAASEGRTGERGREEQTS